MEDFILLQEEIKKLRGNKTSLENIYSLFWEKIVFLKVEERENILAQLSQYNNISALAPVWHLFSKAECHVFSAEYVLAIDEADSAYNLFKSLDQRGGMMSALMMLGVTYRSIGQLDRAQEALLEATRIAKELEQDSMYAYFAGISYYQFGELNIVLKNYTRAIECYSDGLKMPSDKPEYAGRLLSGMGNAYLHTSEWERSLQYFEEALKAIEGTKNFLVESKILADIGSYYRRKGYLHEAFLYQEKSLAIRMDHQLFNPAIGNYIQLAELNLESGKVKEAVEFGMRALEQSEKIKATPRIYEAHHVLSRIYEQTGDALKALHHFKEFHRFNQEVFNKEIITRTEQANTRHKIESMQQEKEIFRLRNVELKSALDEITDSIRYALRIQQSLLPPIKQIEKTLKRLKSYS